jgi:very-short-patch-repair endonuclease
VLRRLLDNSNSLAEIATEALLICHFDPETGDDRHRAAGASEDCEAACYDCLMSYANQREHELLDRKILLGFLQELRSSLVKASPSPKPFADHLQTLKAGCDSNLEKAWLDYLALHGHRLPSVGQKYYSQCSTRPDFVYEREHTAIYVDGPPHDFPERQQRDAGASTQMEDLGITVLRFHHRDDWAEIIARYPNIFGTAQTLTAVPPANQ